MWRAMAPLSDEERISVSISQPASISRHGQREEDIAGSAKTRQRLEGGPITAIPHPSCTSIKMYSKHVIFPLAKFVEVRGVELKIQLLLYRANLIAFSTTGILAFRL